MKRLIRPEYSEDIIYFYYHPKDIYHMLSVLESNGYQASYSDVAWAWELHSNDFAASWLILDGYSDQDIIDVMVKYLQLIEL